MPINAVDRAALETAIERQTALADSLSEEVNELREGKFDRAKWDDAVMNFSVAERQLNMLKSKLEDATKTSDGMSRIDARTAVEASPTVRFLRAALTKNDGNQGLESWEIEQQQSLKNGEGFRGIAKPGDFVLKLPQRALVTTTTTAGAIQHDTMADIVETLVNYGGARKMSQRISTSGGNNLDVPKINDTATGERLTAQGSDANDGGLNTIEQSTLSAFTYSSKYIDLSRESVTDTDANSLDLVGFAMRQCARRLGRVTNDDFTNANGGVSGGAKPEGFLYRASVGHTTPNSTSIDWQSFVDTIYSIDSAYLEGMESGQDGSNAEGGGVVGWQFHRNLEQILVKLADSENRPLWAPGLGGLAGDQRQNMLLGYPYALNYSMPSDMTFGNTAKVIAAFGNFSYHLIRDVDAVLIRVFDNDSVVGSKNIVRVIGFARADSRYIGNGSGGSQNKNSLEYKTLVLKSTG